MKFLIIFITIVVLIMIGVGVVIRKAKRFFSAFIPQQPDNSFRKVNNNDEKVVYDDGKVQVFKGDSK